MASPIFARAIQLRDRWVCAGHDLPGGFKAVACASQKRATRVGAAGDKARAQNASTHRTSSRNGGAQRQSGRRHRLRELKPRTMTAVGDLAKLAAV